jgi:GNAT superfamily N-acetyltransferase
MMNEDRSIMMMEYQLTKSNRILLGRAFQTFPRVDLSINCVLEGQMGRVYVDDINSPTVYKIQTGPFLYFAGDPISSGAKTFLEDIKPYLLLMPSSPGWIESANEMYQGRLACMDRYSFSSESLSIEHLDRLMNQIPMIGEVIPIDLGFAGKILGKDYFIDLSEFDSPEDFVQRGAGFYMKADGQIIGAAYSSLVCSQGIEVSLFVLDEYRRMGVGTILSSILLKWCLQNNVDPHWDAANPESSELARKLGYQMVGGYKAYYLKE